VESGAFLNVCGLTLSGGSAVLKAMKLKGLVSQPTLKQPAQ